MYLPTYQPANKPTALVQLKLLSMKKPLHLRYIANCQILPLWLKIGRD